MAYLVYKYPNGKGYLSSQKVNDPTHIWYKECEDIREAKEVLRELAMEFSIKKRGSGWNGRYFY